MANFISKRRMRKQEEEQQRQQLFKDNERKAEIVLIKTYNCLVDYAPKETIKAFDDLIVGMYEIGNNIPHCYAVKIENYDIRLYYYQYKDIAWCEISGLELKTIREYGNCSYEFVNKWKIQFEKLRLICIQQEEYNKLKKLEAEGKLTLTKLQLEHIN